MQYPKKKPESLDQVAATLAAAVIGKRAKPTADEAVEVFYEIRTMLVDNAPAPKPAAG
jgi:hypothetical protein